MLTDEEVKKAKKELIRREVLAKKLIKLLKGEDIRTAKIVLERTRFLLDAQVIK